MIDTARLKHLRRRNAVQSALVILGMAALTAALGWAVAGASGIVWGSAGGLAALLLQPRLSWSMGGRSMRAHPPSSSGAASRSRSAGIPHGATGSGATGTEPLRRNPPFPCTRSGGRGKNGRLKGRFIAGEVSRGRHSSRARGR